MVFDEIIRPKKANSFRKCQSEADVTMAISFLYKELKIKKNWFFKRIFAWCIGRNILGLKHIDPERYQYFVQMTHLQLFKVTAIPWLWHSLPMKICFLSSVTIMSQIVISLCSCQGVPAAKTEGEAVQILLAKRAQWHRHKGWKLLCTI